MRNVLLVLALTISNAAIADSLVLGRVSKSHVLESAGSACEDEEEAKGENVLTSICMYGWWLWTIDVERTIGGTKVQGRVHAVRTQHTDMLLSYQKKIRLFALKPIEDSEQRKKLHADFYLIDMSQEMYCISQDPQTFGLPEAAYTHGSGDETEYCFDLRTKNDR